MLASVLYRTREKGSNRTSPETRRAISWASSSRSLPRIRWAVAVVMDDSSGLPDIGLAYPNGKGRSTVLQGLRDGMKTGKENVCYNPGFPGGTPNFSSSLHGPTAKVIIQFLAAVGAVQVSEPEPGAAVAAGLHLGQGQQDGLNLLFGGQWSVQRQTSSKSRAICGTHVPLHFNPGRVRSAWTVLAGPAQLKTAGCQSILRAPPSRPTCPIRFPIRSTGG